MRGMAEPFGPPAPSFDFLDVEESIPPALLDTLDTSDAPESSEPEFSPEAIGDSAGISAEALLEFEKQLPELLAAHDSMMEERWEREDDIEDAYAMVADDQQHGAYPGAARMVSEMIMASTDQAKARIVSNLLDVEPMMSVRPIESTAFAGQDAVVAAQAHERFLESYMKFKVDIATKLNRAALRLCKVGTAVWRIDWNKSSVSTRYYDTEGKVQEIQEDTSQVQIDLIRNRDMVLWPCWAENWQKDYELVGHRSVMTISKFRELAAKLELTQAEIEEIERYSEGEQTTADSSGNTFGDLPDPNRTQMDTSSVTALPTKQLVMVTELWGKQVFGRSSEPTRFQCFFHEGTQKILWIGPNPNFNGQHPYFPLGYKVVDGSAWCDGIGHEIFMCQAADTAFRNLELDNLMSAVYSLVLLKQGSLAQQIMDRPFPGQRVPTDDPDGDVKTLSLADPRPLEMIYQGQNANDARKMAASGITAVLSGQGDPTMKSGAGTGAVMALIEQAGKKFGDVDATVRRFLSKAYQHILDLIYQYAPNETFEMYATGEDAAIMEQASMAPLRGGTASQFFRIVAEAPSASNNKEMRKNHIAVLYNFYSQFVQMVVPLAQQIYQMENPAGLTGYMHQIMDFMTFLAQKMAEENDLPSIRDMVPHVDPPTPPEQQINMLTQQLQQMQQYIAQIQGQQPQPQAEGAPG